MERKVSGDAAVKILSIYVDLRVYVVSMFFSGYRNMCYSTYYETQDGTNSEKSIDD